MATPLQFGFGLFPYSRFASFEEMAAVVRRGEDLGYHAVLLPEHLLPPRWPTADLSTKLWYDLPSLAAALAAVTTRIRFLTSVIVFPYHHPVALAKALATVDVISDGRLLCGVGAGWMQAEFRRLAIPFAERGAITDEYLRAMVELWTNEAPSFAGKYIAFEDVSFLPRPVQQPHPPLYIGGTGPRPYQRVAGVGEGWYPMTATLDTIREGRRDIAARMRKLGRDPDSLWVGYTGFSMGADAQVQAMRRHAGDSAAAEPPPATPADAIARIAALREAGVNFLTVGLSWRDATELERELERFAREVMPAFA